MKKIMTFALILSAFIWTGCATTSDVERVESKVASTNSEVLAIRTGIDGLGQQSRTESAKTADKLDALTSQVAGLRDDMDLIKRNQANLGNAMNTMAGGEIMGVTGQMDELKHEVEETSQKLDAVKATLLQKLADIESEMDELKAAGQPAGASASAGAAGEGAAVGAQSATGESQGAVEQSGAPAVPPVADPTQLYQAAYLDYTKGNYELSLSGFRDYLASFPDGEYAGNAQYWVGESLYSLGRYNEALVEFDKVLANYPQSPKAPGAMLKKGFCFEALGRADDAKAAYQKVIDTYPGSDAAKLAADRLNPKIRGQVPAKR